MSYSLSKLGTATAGISAGNAVRLRADCANVGSGSVKLYDSFKGTANYLGLPDSVVNIGATIVATYYFTGEGTYFSRIKNNSSNFNGWTQSNSNVSVYSTSNNTCTYRGDTYDYNYGFVNIGGNFKDDFNTTTNIYRQCDGLEVTV